MCEELEDLTERLSPWELNFYLSVSAQVEAGAVLTETQSEKLLEVYKKATEPSWTR